ncbi:MAG: HAD family hydrolase [Ruminococcaceae bacterium]|nr:HAD family hydrolase [Oscillospiraceae bacterium]
MKYTCVVWDFNGTIFDDMNAGIASVNKMLSERGLDIIPSVQVYREIFDFPIKEYYRVLGFDFEREPYEVLAPIWVDLYNENAKNAGLCPNVAKTMNAIKKLGIRQVIISACEINMLEYYLSKLGVRGYIDEVVGLDNIHAGGKIERAMEWRKNNPEDILIMIGDTVHDSDTARSLGADCVLYAKGHQSRERLSACGCPMVDDISELLSFLK